jgi:hypothetical protein
VIGFIVGYVAGSLFRYKTSSVNRILAAVLVAGEQITTTIIKEAKVVTGQMAEDLEDIVAEAKAGRSEKR